MKFHRQKQTGGDGENIQAGRDVVVNVTGVTPEVAVAIYESRMVMLRQEFSSQAQSLVGERMDRLQQALFEMFKTPELLAAFANPDFQFNILEAQRSAARSGSAEDIGLIVDILVQRAAAEETPRLRVATRKALEVAGLLSTSALAGLTALWYAVSLSPVESNLNSFLSSMNGNLAPLIHELPKDNKWLGDLALLDCITLGTQGFGTLKTVTQLIGENKAPAFTCAGITGGRDDARKSLQDVDIRLGFLLVPHPLDSSLTVLVGRDETNIREIATLVCGGSLSDDADAALTPVIAEMRLQQRLPDYETKLNAEIDKFPNVAAVRDWALNFPALSVTSVGVAVGYANLRRVLPGVNLPDLDAVL